MLARSEVRVADEPPGRRARVERVEHLQRRDAAGALAVHLVPALPDAAGRVVEAGLDGGLEAARVSKSSTALMSFAVADWLRLVNSRFHAPPTLSPLMST